MPHDDCDPGELSLRMSSAYTPTAADLSGPAKPTETWADDVTVIEYVARVWVMRTVDLGRGAPTLYLSEVVDPPVREGGAHGPPLRSVGGTPARALHLLEKRLVQRTAKVAHLRAAHCVDVDEPCPDEATRPQGHRSIRVGRSAAPRPSSP